MKLHFALTAALAIPVDSVPASFNVNPETLVKCLLDIPPGAIPSAYNTVTISPFFTTPGLKTPGQAGIRLQNGAGTLIPFKLDQMTVTAFSGTNLVFTNSPLFYQRINGYWNRKVGSVTAEGEISDQVYPVLLNTGFRASYLSEILNTSPGSAELVVLTSSQPNKDNFYEFGFTKQMYYDQLSNRPIVYALATSYTSRNVWDTPGFAAQIPTALRTAVGQTLTMGASVYINVVIDVDDTAIPQNASASTAVYAILPLSCATVTPSSGTTDTFTRNTTNIDNLTSQVAITELIVPINKIDGVNGAGTGIGTTYNFPSTGAQVAFSNKVIGFNVNISSTLGIGTKPFLSTGVIDPPQTTGAVNV